MHGGNCTGKDKMCRARSCAALLRILQLQVVDSLLSHCLWHSHRPFVPSCVCVCVCVSLLYVWIWFQRSIQMKQFVEWYDNEKKKTTTTRIRVCPAVFYPCAKAPSAAAFERIHQCVQRISPWRRVPARSIFFLSALLQSVWVNYSWTRLSPSAASETATAAASTTTKY